MTIQGPDGDFHGRIKSPDAGCLGDRLVRLFMSDSAGGPFVRTGNSDTSQQQGNVGEWSLGNTGLRDGFLMVLNDEAHHTHEEDNEWNKVIHRLHEKTPITTQLDFSATPKFQKGAIFPWTI